MTLSEKEKMLAGDLYRSTDPEIQAAMAEAQRHLRRLNSIPNEDADHRFVLLHELLGLIVTLYTSESVTMGSSTMNVCSLTAIPSTSGMMLRLGREFTSTLPYTRLILRFDAAD